MAEGNFFKVPMIPVFAIPLPTITVNIEFYFMSNIKLFAKVPRLLGVGPLPFIIYGPSSLNFLQS